MNEELRRTERARARAEAWQKTAQAREFAAPEPVAPVMPYRRALSASGLKLFAECERKWYFRYLCNVIEDPGSIAGAYGTAFHAALEYLHQEFTQPSFACADAMQDKLNQLLRAAFARHAAELGSPLEAQLQLRRALATAPRYITWICKRAQTEPFTVVGNESTVSLRIDGHVFTGYIDRLDQADRDGAITVVDYKTGSIAESATEYRDDVANFEEFQLPLYYWARTALGETVRSLSLIPLKDPQKDVQPIEVEIVPGEGRPSGRSARGTIGIRELERAKARMAELAQVLTVDTKSVFETTTDPDACTYCAYREACRSRPLRQTDMFGR